MGSPSVQIWSFPEGKPIRSLVYDTSAGPVVVDNLLIRPGGTLRIVGAAPFFVTAKDSIVEYQRWIGVTVMIEDAGGLLTIQREEETRIA